MLSTGLALANGVAAAEGNLAVMSSHLLPCWQASFRWAGDANIAIAIEPAIAGSTLRMVPKVSDLRVRLPCSFDHLFRL